MAGALHLPFADKAPISSTCRLSPAAPARCCKSCRSVVLAAVCFRLPGTSFAFITPIILAGKTGGLALVFGMSLTMAVVPLALAPFLPRFATRVFSPVVAGTVVLLIGLLLIPDEHVRHPGAAARHTTRPSMGLVAAGVVLALVVTFNTLRAYRGRGCRRRCSRWRADILLCLAVGGVQAPEGGAWFAVPQPLRNMA